MPITWEEYVNVRLAVCAIGLVVAFAVGTIAAIMQWHEDCHVNDDPDPGELPAGKTLGL